MGAVAGLLALFFTPESRAQPFRRDPYGIPVNVGGEPKEHPFLGGLYNPIHEFVDLDGDQDLDLFLLDNNDGSLTFLRNTGTAAVPAFRWESPGFAMPSLRGWFRFSDVNGDGLIDLLTAGDSLNTVALHRNDGSPAVPFFTRIPGPLRDTHGVPVFVQEQCIPALADIDADSDPDFFSLNPSIGTINFYENTGGIGSLLLEFRTDFYQEIRICPGCGAPGAPALHGQGTMEFADIDADGDHDMLYGDLFDDGLFFYRNIGTPAQALLDSVTGRFPDVQPVITAGFNQPTLDDIDADGDLDLFVSVLPPFQQKDNLYFYRNDGTPASFSFVLVTRNYLGCLDQGLQSAPALADIDADRDVDLFVGDLFGRIAFFRNTGNGTEASFSLEDTALIASSTRFAYVPALTDIDRDGDLDLFAGHFTGSVEFYRNEGTAGQPAFTRELSPVDSLAVGLYAAPAFFDADGDGDPDLFVGKGDGRIAFYRNDGPLPSPRFTLLTQQFQAIQRDGNSRPTFVDVDGDNDSDLVVGDAHGSLALYQNDGPAGAPIFTEVPGRFADLDTMRESSPAFADLDGDHDQDLMAGNLRGGVFLYRNDLVTALPNTGDRPVPGALPLLLAFPNPFNFSTTFRFRAEVSGAARLRIVDLLGREVATLLAGAVGPGEYAVRWDASGCASGAYLGILDAGGRRTTTTVLLLR